MKYVVAVLIAFSVLVLGWYLYQRTLTNPRVTAELRDHPNGATAARVMLITLPSGKTLPVNYLREGAMVYAGADGRWWRELRDPGADVHLLIRGEELMGHAVAVEQDPARTEDVFRRLRPDSYKWIGGMLVEIELRSGT